MKRRAIAMILTILICISICSGCGKTEKVSNEKFSLVDWTRFQVKEEGCYYIDGYTCLMTFYDFKLGKSIPICDRPNCRHNSKECKAYLMNGFRSGAGVYRNHLYFFDTEDSEFPLYQADRTGNNRKVAARLNKNQTYSGGVSVSMPMYFIEDQLLLLMEYMEVTEESVLGENGEAEDFESFWQIVSIDLNSGKTEIIKEPVKREMNGDIAEIRDYADGKILYSLENSIFAFDLKTKREEQVLEWQDETVSYDGCLKSNGKMYYHVAESKDGESVTCLYEKDLERKEERCIAEEKNHGKNFHVKRAGEEVYYGVWGEPEKEDDVYKVYHTAQNTTEEISREEYLYAPMYTTKDWYVTDSDRGYLCIRKQDYEEKNWKKVQVIGRF